MDDNSVVPLKEHFEALRAADERALTLVREWTKERLESHNKLLEKWQEATSKDRERFATRESLDALKEAFDLYKEITAKALALAEGKSRGIDAVRVVLISAVSVIGALLAVWAAVRAGVPL